MRDGIGPHDAPGVKLDKLETVLGLARDRLSEVAPLIASMLMIRPDNRYPSIALLAG
jgi:hypothetical protein